MSEHIINSSESEGLFNEFIQDELENLLDHILSEGELERLGDHGSDVIIEIDDIVPPRFIFDDESGGSAGDRGREPGKDKERLRFLLPFQTLMKRIAERLELPELVKEGDGKIKEVSHSFKTFGPIGLILDKRRTFKRALRSSIGLGTYDPDQERFLVQVRRRDRRYKVPQRTEKPCYKAVVFYMGDISYSTYGERLAIEKRLVNFIQQWLDFNYGIGNVEHRFFVHDVEAHEVSAEDFYKISNAGGTRASVAFDLVSQVAANEYDVGCTNFYGFYFGDGEIFEADAKKIVRLLGNEMRPMFNRVGIVEVQPSEFSYLWREVKKSFKKDRVIRAGRIHKRKETIDVIKELFGEVDA